jgi:acyl-CoA thioesterase
MSTDAGTAAARAMYAADTASQHVGIAMTDLSTGRSVARMTVTGTMVNGHGICHGGYVFMLADSAFAFACNTYDEVTVAASCQVAYLQPVRLGDELVATAVERYRVGRTGLYDVTVERVDADGRQVVAEFRGHSRTTGSRPGNEQEEVSNG